ncbi:hypothetical protein OOK13_20845 [Streptomyces sp. NBC_00378]|uniref:hypothetical protein n=1 Tax=unclassified Streptomyces TaxID=2593676 RepID=UPI002257E9D8|nr:MULTISPECIES: hypothetical protein [unclassified Streptomyces]MCX5110950.1 hypothetical protein [Streptomyces sp. NBC_00378]
MRRVPPPLSQHHERQDLCRDADRTSAPTGALQGFDAHNRIPITLAMDPAFPVTTRATASLPPRSSRGGGPRVGGPYGP